MPWAFTNSGEASCATALLADFSPGYLIKDAVPSTAILSSQQETARALDIPPDIHVLILSDSTLTLFRSAEGKKQGFDKPGKQSVVPEFEKAHPFYTVTKNVWDGATIANILSALPRDQAVIDSIDVTIVVCNINRPKGHLKVFHDDSDQAMEFMKLCLGLRKHKRALVFIGGSGEI